MIDPCMHGGGARSKLFNQARTEQKRDTSCDYYGRKRTGSLLMAGREAGLVLSKAGPVVVFSKENNVGVTLTVVVSGRRRDSCASLLVLF